VTDYERGWRAGVEACHDYGRDMALHFLERTAQHAATGEGERPYPTGHECPECGRDPHDVACPRAP